MNTVKKTHWLLTTILVLIVCAAAGVALSAVRFLRDPGPTYASATMVLTFDGAAEGVAPNGVAFDLRDLDCDEVLSRALSAAGLEGTYTPEQIRSCLTVRGVYPDAMAEKVMRYESLLDFDSGRELTVGDYHPTTFNLTLTDGFDGSISKSQLTALLRGITDAYRDRFARIYAYGLSTDDTVFDLEEYDYPQQLEIIEGRLSAVSSYADALYKKAPAFRYQGVGFNDISVRLNMLIDNSLTRLSADLTINALTRDTERMLTQYQYKILDLGIRREKQTQELNSLDKLIASYEKNEIIYVSTADSLTKIDGNSSQTYDALVSRRKTVADGITKLSSSIANYELRISDLLQNTSALQGEAAEELPEGEEPPAATGPTPEESAAAEQQLSAQRAALEESIRALVGDGDAVIGDFKRMLDSYNEQQINELTVSVTEPAYRTPSLVSGTFVLQAVKTAGPIAAIGFMVCMALIAISRRREERDG